MACKMILEDVVIEMVGVIIWDCTVVNILIEDVVEVCLFFLGFFFKKQFQLMEPYVNIIFISLSLLN